MEHTDTLKALMEYVEKRYPFDEAHYPNYNALSRAEQMQFAIRHILLHTMKNAGKIAGELEQRDHGGELDPETLKEAAAKLLVNSVNLGVVLNLTPEEFSKALDAALK